MLSSLKTINSRTLCLRPLKSISLSYRHPKEEYIQKFMNFQTARFSSQLYPATSQSWNKAMLQVETILGDTSSYSNLRQWVSGEYTTIMKYLQKLVGTNHPMLETAKRCAYIGEGRMGSAQARGLIVLLTAKTASQKQDLYNELIYKNQMSLAEMTEMIYSAFMIHRGVMDLKMASLKEGTIEPSENSSPEIRSSKAIHYGNKLSVLSGDFLLAYVMRGLGDLHNSKVVDLMATAITDFMEGEFLLIEDWRNLDYLRSENSRDLARWEKRTYSTIGSLQGNSCQSSMLLAGKDTRLQMKAYDFGKNLGFAWQAHAELQPFRDTTYRHVELPEMPPFPAFDLNCLPVIHFMRNIKDVESLLNNIKCNSTSVDGNNNGDINYDQHQHQESISYEELHNLIVKDGRAIDETHRTIESYAREAIGCLEEFPVSQSRDIMHAICRSLCSRA